MTMEVHVGDYLDPTLVSFELQLDGGRTYLVHLHFIPPPGTIIHLGGDRHDVHSEEGNERGQDNNVLPSRTIHDDNRGQNNNNENNTEETQEVHYEFSSIRAPMSRRLHPSFRPRNDNVDDEEDDAFLPFAQHNLQQSPQESTTQNSSDSAPTGTSSRTSLDQFLDELHEVHDGGVTAIPFWTDDSLIQEEERISASYQTATDNQDNSPNPSNEEEHGDDSPASPPHTALDNDNLADINNNNEEEGGEDDDELIIMPERRLLQIAYSAVRHTLEMDGSDSEEEDEDDSVNDELVTIWKSRLLDIVSSAARGVLETEILPSEPEYPNYTTDHLDHDSGDDSHDTDSEHDLSPLVIQHPTQTRSQSKSPPISPHPHQTEDEDSTSSPDEEERRYTRRRQRRLLSSGHRGVGDSGHQSRVNLWDDSDDETSQHNDLRVSPLRIRRRTRDISPIQSVSSSPSPSPHLHPHSNSNPPPPQTYTYLPNNDNNNTDPQNHNPAWQSNPPPPYHYHSERNSRYDSHYSSADDVEYPPPPPYPGAPFDRPISYMGRTIARDNVDRANDTSMTTAYAGLRATEVQERERRPYSVSFDIANNNHRTNVNDVNDVDDDNDNGNGNDNGTNDRHVSFLLPRPRLSLRDRITSWFGYFRRRHDHSNGNGNDNSRVTYHAYHAHRPPTPVPSVVGSSFSISLLYLHLHGLGMVFGFFGLFICIGIRICIVLGYWI